MSNDESSKKLVTYIRSLSDFRFEDDIQYDHIGALITDAILQAGINYIATVKPRVDHVLTYPEALTTTGFLSLLHRIGSHELLNWRDEEKPNRVVKLTEFFVSEHVETIADLNSWLKVPANIDRLRHQRGVGPKTLDYIKNLAGLSTSAIDRHLNNFMALAGIKSTGYEESRSIINQAAGLLGVSEHTLDHSIWLYMSQSKQGPTSITQTPLEMVSRFVSDVGDITIIKRMTEKGDVLISKKQSYHYVVESVSGNQAIIRWLERVSGEPVAFYQYTRKILITSSAYRIIRKKNVDRSQYQPPKKGWPD